MRSRRPPLPRRFFHPEEAGNVAVEFGLMAPILLMMLIGLLDFGGAVHHQVQMADAVRVGTQIAIARPPSVGDLTEVETATRLAAPAGGSDTRVIVVDMFCEMLDGSPAVCDDTPTPGRATFVRVRMSETWPFILPYPGLGSELPLQVGQVVRVS